MVVGSPEGGIPGTELQVRSLFVSKMQGHCSDQLVSVVLLVTLHPSSPT